MGVEFPWDYFEQKAKNLGFLQMGFTQLVPPSTEHEGLKHYEAWLSQNYHGEMDYLEKHLPLKINPELYIPGVRSAFVFSFPYFPHPESSAAPAVADSELRIALYARGGDYHHWLQEKLSVLQNELQQKFPDEIFFSATDSKPVLERDLAFRAGLGWFGKNTCLISRRDGSLFLIGEILTSLQLEKTIELSPDFCGTCNRCIEVCPTGALEAPRQLNANKCISYLTIESSGPAPLALRPQLGDWFFGCDLCQTVCPWNQKIFKEKLEVLPLRQINQSQKEKLISELKDVLTLSGKQLLKKYQGSPLSRAGHRGLRRNAMNVIANLGLKELQAEVQAWQEDEKLSEMTTWTLEKLNSPLSPAIPTT